MHPEFAVERIRPVDEIHATLYELVHKGCGARVVHIECDDPENLFSLGFRTLPESSNGVAHILEHTVLCGSKKYPVKDPFFSMIKRSLNTFMNAMTGPDITFYPAATLVKDDFYNLLEVYLDAVFFPNLLEFSFEQEGVRLEFEKAEDATSPLLFKGIVFNEMKGALASPDARAWKRMASLLYPDTPYRHESGGDPKRIPDLTYEELKAFHKAYYDPSRCVFFFYGNLPLDGHLDFIHEKVLKGAQQSERLTPIPMQKRASKAVSGECRYPLGDEEEDEERHMIWLGWLTCNALEPMEALALSVLEIALMGSDAAPLKRALLESGLCKQAFSFFEPDLLDVPFCIGMKGCEEGKAEEIETLVMESLKTIALSGEANALVEGAIHQLEFSRLEIGGEGAPFGLTLFDRTVPLLLHGGDPLDGLTIHSLFKALRARFTDPAYINTLIQRYLLENGHRCRLEMIPDKEVEEQEESAEKEHLALIREGLSKEEEKAIVEEAVKLAVFQKEQEGADLEVLPKIHLSQVPKEPIDYPLQIEECGPLKLYHHTCFTNEIVYASLQFDLPPISGEELPLLRLLTGMLAQVGCGGRNYAENLAYIQRYTGGVGAGLALNVEVGGIDKMHPQISVGGKALRRDVDKFFPLLRDMCASADFTDEERVQELLVQHASHLETSVIRQAMGYATTLASSTFSSAGKIQQEWYGTDYLQFVRSLAKDPSGLVDQLCALQQRLFSGKPHLVVGCGEDALPELCNRGFYGLDEWRIEEESVWKPSEELSSVPSQGRIIASPVAFTCRMFECVPYVHPDAPALMCVAKLLGNQTLHKEIREQGGAYGAGARYTPSLGTFHFYAYRDPHFKKSLAAMDLAVQRVAEGKVETRELEEALLCVIQALDTPTSPGNRAVTSYGRWTIGKHKEVRQAFRDRLLALTKEQVAYVAKEHLLPKMEQAVVISFAGSDLLESSGLELLPV